jgi:DNA-binding HxlR family transcriptional regulator
MKGYGQFCPIAKASEVLGERWTHLVIRELICGSSSFNDLRRGVPLMSPSLLSARLKSLHSAGVVDRIEDENGVNYVLTEAGLELKPIIMQLGVWGHRWVRSKLTREDLDPSLLIWDIQRNIDTDAFPRERTILHVEFTDYDKKYRNFWLVIMDGDVDVCMKDPGHDVALKIMSDAKTLTGVWMGDLGLRQALRTGLIRLDGAARLKKTLSSWLGRSYYAEIKPAKHVSRA